MGCPRDDESTDSLLDPATSTRYLEFEIADARQNNLVMVVPMESGLRPILPDTNEVVAHLCHCASLNLGLSSMQQLKVGIMPGAPDAIERNAEYRYREQHHNQRHISQREMPKNLRRHQPGPRGFGKLDPRQDQAAGKYPEARHALLHEEGSREVQPLGSLMRTNLVFFHRVSQHGGHEGAGGHRHRAEHQCK